MTNIIGLTPKQEMLMKNILCQVKVINGFTPEEYEMAQVFLEAYFKEKQ